MSGQPINSQSDENKFRNEYMETLNLQSQINDMNLQANKNYLMTGQLPTVSQMIDTRTTTEKLEDVEKLKRDISDKMTPIAQPAVAYAITNKILSSPLNVSNSLFRFYAQRVEEIVSELKKLYPYGIAYENSDIDSIVTFIQNMYSETQGKIQSMRSYMNSTSSTTIGTQVVSADNLSQILVQLQHILRKLKTSDTAPGPMTKKLNNIVDIISDISYSLPSSNQMSLLNKQISGTLIPGVKAEDNEGNARDAYIHQLNLPRIDLQIIRRYFKLLEKLPKFNAVDTIIKKIDKYYDISINSQNYRPDTIKNMNDGLDGLKSLFGAFDTKEGMDTLRDFTQEILPKLLNFETIESGREELLREYNIIDDKIRDMENEGTMSRAENEQLHALHARKNIIGRQLSQKYGERNFGNMGAQPGNNQPGNNQPGNNQQHPELTYVQGDGIKQKKRRGRPRGAGIIKVEKPPNYIGFGINEINRKKMNEKNILTIRRNNSRTNIPDLPSRHISDGFKSVLNTIVGGGIPKFNDMSKLTEEEQEYLYKLVSKSNLEDKLSVPVPSKDGLDKDFHEFEKMKGEILSGNDSRELVKKFKGLIMKLSRNGYLPKNEVNELLELLSSLSY